MLDIIMKPDISARLTSLILTTIICYYMKHNIKRKNKTNKPGGLGQYTCQEKQENS